MPRIAPDIAHRHFAPEPDGRTAAGTIARRADPLDADRIDFEAWLLPPLPIGQGERLVRAVSTIAGPIAFVGAAALSLVALF